MKRKRVRLKPIKPNWALGNEYSISLTKLTRSMVKAVIQEGESIYKHEWVEIELILDESPVYQIHKKFTIMLDKWIMQFSKIANKNVHKFIDKVDSNVQKQIKQSLSPVTDQVANLTVKFDAHNRRALLAKQATIKENIDLIKNIPTKMKEQILFSVNEGMTRGRNWRYVEERLHKIGNFTEGRAKRIAKDQINKATSVVSHARQAELGITKQEWHYTYISKEPRQSHLHANGKVYDINKGCWIDGKFIYPAEEPGCNCNSGPYMDVFN